MAEPYWNSPHTTTLRDERGDKDFDEAYLEPVPDQHPVPKYRAYLVEQPPPHHRSSRGHRQGSGVWGPCKVKDRVAGKVGQETDLEPLLDAVN